MTQIFSILGTAIAAGGALVALYAVARNWLWLARRQRAPHASPILLVGPLFSLIAAGAFAKALPDIAGWEVWLFPALVAVADPAALPLVIRGVVNAGAGDEDD